MVALHLVATDVDPFTDGVSAYALTRVGSLYRIQVVATGFGALVLTLALVAGGPTSWIGFAALATFAAARILIARFPTDPRGTNQISSHGRAHILLAAVTFVTIAIAAPTISGALTASQTWRGPTSLITALGWATTILALGTFGAAGTPTTRRFFGLVERGAYGTMLTWILLTALSVIWWI